MSWEQAVSVERLQERPFVFKRKPLQIALFWASGKPYAIDNRCPHEGYPLAEGTIAAANGEESCLLTCNWHNWKFRLADGECVLGGDHVRAYPTKVENGVVWIDTSPPPPNVAQRQILKGLRTAFDERDFGRICREISRLHFHGLDPELAVRAGIEWAHDKQEFGYTHAFAATADWLALARRSSDWEPQLVCLAEPVDHLAFDSLRYRSYPYPPAATSFDAAAFCTAVEDELRQAAEALAVAAARDELTWQTIEGAFAQAALAHYNDFGHSLIYVYKTRQLIDALGESVAPHLLPLLARSLSYATREDLIPEFKHYAPALETIQSFGAATEPPPSPFGLSVNQALDWLVQNAPHHRPLALYDALLAASSKNMLCYDTAYQEAFDRNVNDNVGWLDFTHGVTFGNAVRAICTTHPRLWPAGLAQMACFVGRNTRYLDRDVDESVWRVDDAESFFAQIHDRLLDHGLRDPIFSAHLVKTSIAVEEELPAASPDCRQYLLSGLNRFLNSPLKQKHVRRLARQAIDLVKRDFE